MLLETKRLLLRELTQAHLAEVVALHSDPEVARFVRPLDRAQAEERLLANEKEWRERGHGMFAAIDRDRDRFIGRVGLKYWPQFDETEAGWVLRRDAWGHGYATEGARACVEWGFAVLPVAYLTAMIHPENARSISVAGRLGFKSTREDVLLGDPVLIYTVERRDGAGDPDDPAAHSGRCAVDRSAASAGNQFGNATVSSGRLDGVPDDALANELAAAAERMLSATSETSVDAEDVAREAGRDPDDSDVRNAFKEIERRGTLKLDGWRGGMGLPAFVSRP